MQLAPDGTVDMDLAQKAMENLPDALKEKASDVISECGHHAASLEPGEASCESYREFIGCMLDVALKVDSSKAKISSKEKDCFFIIGCFFMHFFRCALNETVKSTNYFNFSMLLHVYTCKQYKYRG